MVELRTRHIALIVTGVLVAVFGLSGSEITATEGVIAGIIQLLGIADWVAARKRGE